MITRPSKTTSSNKTKSDNTNNRRILTSIRGLYAITDSHLGSNTRLLSSIEAVLEGGARLIQYRNKHATAEIQLQQARLVKKLCHQYQALFIVNDSLELCQEVAADGIHLGQSDGEVASARRRLGNEAIIGVTCHDNIELAIDAEQRGASYVAFGRFFPSLTKPDAPACPLQVLAQAKNKLHIPVVAIGGITPGNFQQLIDQGANAIAVIHALFAQGQYSTAEIRHTAHQFSDYFQSN